MQFGLEQLRREGLLVSHVQVHDNDLRLELIGQLDGFGKTGSFCDDLDFGCVFEQASNHTSDHFVVIGEKYGDGHECAAILALGR